ncbi:hypothetical protein TNCV_4080151 [Trichonephila clavipes]|nr:hypothetical protein TNCV_4080151 [Trichonephila clavipes]
MGCPLHTLHANSPCKFPSSSPTHTQKRNNEGFISPRQTAKHVLLETPSFQNNLENQFPLPTTINSSEFPALPTSQQTSQQNAQAGGTTSSSTAANMNTTQTGVTPSSQKPGLTNTSTQGVQPRVTPSSTQNNTPKVPLPPPVMLFITKHYREQLKTFTMIFPILRTKTTDKHSPDIILIQETHLRPSHSFNIANYRCYRNDRITEDRAAGGTLILIKNNIKHYHLPTPALQAIEATIVIINLPNHNPIPIVSCYIPPNSDTNIFTIDLENLIQTSSDCIIFGDLNATHSAWNCTHNSTKSNKLLDFTNLLNFSIAYPNSPTRFGHVPQTPLT